MKIVIFLIILLLILGGTMGVYHNFKEKVKNFIMGEENKQLFQGPVPEGYDEEHFRLTGETKPVED